MKILLFIENFRLGGHQLFLYNLFSNLKKIDECQIDIVYLNDGQLHSKFQDISYNVYGLWGVSFKSYLNPIIISKIYFKLLKILNTNKYDIVFSNGIMSYGLISLEKILISKFIHIRIIGGPFKDIEPTYDKYFRYLLPFHKKTDFFIGFSSVNNLLVKRGIRESQLYNCSYGVNTKQFYPMDKSVNLEIRKKYKISENDLVIGWIGRISPNMQIKHTINLCGELRNRGVENFKLLIVGGGDWVYDMNKRIETLNIKENCIHLDWQPPEYIPYLIQSMDIVPLLEEDPVGGNIIREAMSCGKLVISVNGSSGYQSEWITNRYNGILVDPSNFINETADIVQDFIKNRHNYNYIMKNGREYCIANLDYINTAKSVLVECKKLLNA